MPKTPPKKLVKRYEDSIHYSLDGMTVEEAVKWLGNKESEIKDVYPDVEKISLLFDTLDWDSGNGLFITGYAPETSEEKKARKYKEQADQLARDEYDRQQFERLKQKFK